MTGVLTIGEELTILNAAEQKSMLLEAIDGVDACELDLSMIEELDTAGLQVLMLVVRELRRRNALVAPIRSSDAVVAVLSTLGLDADLLPVVEPGTAS